MKILRIVNSTNPEAGGVIEAINQTAKALSLQGCKTEVLCSDPMDVPWLESFDFKIYAVGKGKTAYAYNAAIKTWLFDNAKKYNHIIIDGIWQYHSLATWQVCQKLNISYSIYTHGMLDPYFKRRYPLKHLKKWLFWPWSDYRVLRDAQSVFFTCQEERDLASQSFWLYKAKPYIAPIGTSVHNYDQKKCKDLFFEKYPELETKENLVFLSRIHPKKGCDMLIKAFADVLKDRPEYHLIMAGPDQVGWVEELKKLAENLGISDRITWTGMVKNEMKYGAYFISEAFILPSHQENFGIVVAEALSCAKPVLISNKVNIFKEIVEDGAGLVEDDNLEGTKSLLNKWLSMTDSEKGEMSKRAINTFENRFEINTAAQSLIDCLNH